MDGKQMAKEVVYVPGGYEEKTHTGYLLFMRNFLPK